MDKREHPCDGCKWHDEWLDADYGGITEWQHSCTHPLNDDEECRWDCKLKEGIE